MGGIVLTIFDIINLGLVIFFWWFTVKNYKLLPRRIPIHFDPDGKADNFGSKKYSFLMPFLLTLCYIGFAFIVRFPESVNYPVKITEENEHAQFLIMKFFIRWLFVLVGLIFLNGQDYMFRYSFDEKAKPRVPLATSIFAIIGSLIVLFLFVGLFK